MSETKQVFFSDIAVSSIKHFDFDNLDDNPTIVILGEPDCGKTTLIQDLYNKYFYDVNNVHVLCKESDMEMYDDWHDVHTMGSTYSDFELEAILDEMIEDANAIIIDACVFSIFTRGPVKKLIRDAKERNIILIISSLWYLAVQEIVDLFDYIFFFPTEVNEIRIYNCYGSIFGEYELFQSWFRVATSRQYDCMVLVNDINYERDKWMDQIFWYGANYNQQTKVLMDQCQKLFTVTI